MIVFELLDDRYTHTHAYTRARARAELPGRQKDKQKEKKNELFDIVEVFSWWVAGVAEENT